MKQSSKVIAKTTPTVERIVEAVMKHNECDRTSEYVYIHSNALRTAIASVLDEKVTGEEIEKEAESFGGNGKYLTDKKDGFREGAKWMRDRCARPEWVKVEDRLPGEPMKVDVWKSRNGIWWRITDCIYDGKVFSKADEKGAWTRIDNVKFWQTLPAPPVK